jgi:hypothetical protein
MGATYMSHCPIGWEDIGSDDHEPGNLPVFIAPMAYADRRVLSINAT